MDKHLPSKQKKRKILDKSIVQGNWKKQQQWEKLIVTNMVLKLANPVKNMAI